MNLFTAAQLIGHNSPSTYYDTNTGTVKYSLMPTLTSLGNTKYDITLIPNNKSKNVNNLQNKRKIMKSEQEPEIKHKNPRKTVIYPDELRCCANTSDGSQCSLKRCKQSSELCYIHYQKTLPKIEKQTPVVETPKKWYHFW